MNFHSRSDVIRIVRGLLILSVISTLLVLFQNCGRFEVADSSSLSSIENKILGESLYNQNCLSCHGELGLSTKKNRSYDQISTAIMNTPQMQNLMTLSRRQLEAIASVLNPSAPSAQIYQCKNRDARGTAEKRMRRLIKSELVNTLTDLLGSSIISNAQISIYLSLLKADIVDSSVNDLGESPADTQVAALLEISNTAADLIFNSTQSVSNVFGSCANQTVISDVCVSNFITNFGLKSLRRPVTTAEHDKLITHYNNSKGVEGLKKLLMRFILSPEMAFHIEIGSSTTSNGRTRLTDYEIASRISYRIAGTLPDTALFNAAKNGELQTIENVKFHSQRLLQTSKGKIKVADLFRFYTQLNHYSKPYERAAILQDVTTSGLKQEMQTETIDFINNIVWTKKSQFSELLTSREVFPRSERMAKILETNLASGNTPSLTNGNHAGLVLRPGLLSSAGSITKPFTRANIIRRRLLCEEFGAPDPTLISSREEEVGDLTQMSNRDRSTYLTNVPLCMTCHKVLNPTGFVLENYDQLGMLRSTESTWDDAGRVIRTHAIDTRVGFPFLEDSNGPVTSMTSGQDLVNAIAGGKVAKGCFAKTVFEYQRWRSALPEDHCALYETEQIAMGAGSVQDIFITSVANEDIFWKAKE